jgi:SAM-dependent methyltransferase
MTEISTQLRIPLTGLRLKCLQCSSELEITSDAAVCPNCKKSWPIKDGIPRFFEPPYYWGEIEQKAAVSFLDEVRKSGWREAASRRFADNADLISSVVDERRIAWFPMLGIRDNSVALDIGSGLGAITQALSKGVSTVYSLEAMTERVEFTRLRLFQEGISNVHQIQGTALDLPFCDETFDLIVVNGVLEWVGEWSQNGDPREIQLNFLRNLARLLKKNGIVVIGIENRIGYAMFRGGRDHSGLAYTSLMPRKVAGVYMRYAKGKHYRTTLDSKRGYRTFTYSEKGNRKLLNEAGLATHNQYWAQPGYNQPYSLIPLHDFALQSYLRMQWSEPIHAWNSSWKRWIKKKLSRPSLIRPMVTEFVIFARRSENRESVCERLVKELQTLIPEVRIPSKPDFELLTNGTKKIIVVFDTETGVPQLIIKANSASGNPDELAGESHNLEIVSGCLANTSAPPFDVPKALGCARLGNCTYDVETAAKGQQIRQIVFLKPDRMRFQSLRDELPRCVEVAIELALLMRGKKEVRTLDPIWWQLPNEDHFVKAPHVGPSANDDWIQHGDFTIENIFIEPKKKKITLIDWEHMTRGLPPLYDVFTLLVSALPAAHTEKESLSAAAGWDKHFLAAFFGKGQSANLFKELIVKACNQMQIPQTQVWEIFLQFLVLRINDFKYRKSGHQEIHKRFLALALGHAKNFIHSEQK